MSYENTPEVIADAITNAFRIFDGQYPSSTFADVVLKIADALSSEQAIPGKRVNIVDGLFELSKAVRTASTGDEILGIGSLIQEASKEISSAIRELTEAVLDAGGTT